MSRSAVHVRAAAAAAAVAHSPLAQLLIVVLGAIAVNPYTRADPDLGWALDAGARILDGGGIPRFNDRTFIEPEHAVVLHGWATDAIFALVQARWGGTGLALMRVGIVALSAAALWWSVAHQCRSNLLRVLLPLAGMAVMPSMFIVVRAQMLSFALLVWTVSACLDGRRRALWSLVPLFALWPNLHGAFPAGLAMVGAYMAASLVEKALGRRAELPLHDLVLIPCAAAMATMCNPYGVSIWTFIHATADIASASVLPEWFPSWHSFSIAALWKSMLFLWAMALAAFILLPRADLRMRLVIVVAAFLMLVSVRHLRIAPAILIPILAFALNRFIDKRLMADGARDLVVTTFGATAVLACAFQLPAIVSLQQSSIGLPPSTTTAFLMRNHLEGRIWTPLTSGGAILWACPTCTVSIDGRAQAAYSVSWFVRALDMEPLPDKDLLIRYRVDYAIVLSQTEVLQLLQPEFFPLYCNGEQCVLSGRATDRARSYTFPPPLPDSILFAAPGRPVF